MESNTLSKHNTRPKENVIQKNEKNIKDVYEMTKKPLGTGGFGVVTKCKHKVTKQLRACKTVPKKNVVANMA